VAYISKALGPKAQGLFTYEKECMAVILAATKWKSYLQQQEFTIATNHKSLIHLGEQKIQEGMQHKAFLKLLGLQYKILYKKGLENKAADALSRQAEPSTVAAISTSTPRWLEIIVEGYTKDDQTKQLLVELSIIRSNDKGFSLSDGLIKYKNRIWLGNHTEAHRVVLLALHSSGLGGHSGITATYHKVRALFAWPNLKQSVIDYINACKVCAQAKPEHCRLPGLLQPLLVPNTLGTLSALILLKVYPSPSNLTLFWSLSTN